MSEEGERDGESKLTEPQAGWSGESQNLGVERETQDIRACVDTRTGLSPSIPSSVVGQLCNPGQTFPYCVHHVPYRK